MPSYARLQRPPQLGFSLVEMMISITIGLLILSTLTTLFVAQSRSRVELDKSNRMIDNGRYAQNLLAENLQLAGFYGELDPTTFALPATASVTAGPCSVDPVVLSDMLRLHVFGYNASSATASIASPPCAMTYTAGSAQSVKAGSDILVLRRADTSAPTVPGTNTGQHLQVSLCYLDSAPLYRIDSNTANFTLRQRNCTTSSTAAAAVRRFYVQTYFVSPDNVAGDGVPTLKRIDLNPDGSATEVVTPLVEGIEYFQVEYGVDGDSDGDGVIDLADFDGVPDSYVQTCTDSNCWSNVVSAKIHLVARNLESTANYTDTKSYSLGAAGNYTPSGTARNYKRHAYTQLVRLVNPAGRRE